MVTTIIAIAVLGGLAIYLALPRGGPARLKPLMWAASGAALVLLWGLWLANFQGTGLGRAALFLPLATLAVVAAFMMITRRNPVRVALWFAVVVLAVAGLMLLVGAQFVAAVTVIVYAGAVIVMFLFVIMLAGQTGREYYDRVSRDPELAVAAGATLLALVMLVAVSSYGGSPSLWPDRKALPDQSEIAAMSSRPGAAHVAPLGRALYAVHWLSVELAGTLLLVALVAAVLIVGTRRHAQADAAVPNSGAGQVAPSGGGAGEGERGGQPNCAGKPASDSSE